MLREDYIHRLIRQLIEAIARIAGLNRRGDHDRALAEADEAWGKLLDAPRELINAVDTPTLASMLRDPEKMRVCAQLLLEEGRAFAGKGDPVHAQLRYRRAMELILEARAIARSGAGESIEASDADDGILMELSREVPIDTLDARYRSRA